MPHKASQKRIEANLRNVQESTGPRTAEGKAKSAINSTIHGFSSLNQNPLAPGCFLHTEDERQFRGLFSKYVVTYNPQHLDEFDLLTEAVFAKWRQQRIWLPEAGQIEIAIAQGESELRKSLPRADANLRRRHCQIGRRPKTLPSLRRPTPPSLSQLPQHLRDLQVLRRPQMTHRANPNRPRETETAPPIEPNVCKPEPEPDEPTLPPVQARLAYMQSEIQRFEDYQAQIFRASFRQSQPE